MEPCFGHGHTAGLTRDRGPVDGHFWQRCSPRPGRGGRLWAAPAACVASFKSRVPTGLGKPFGQSHPTPGVSRLAWIYLQKVANQALTLHPEWGPRAAGKWEAACSVIRVRTGEQVHREAQTLLFGLAKNFIQVKDGQGAPR